MDIVEIATNMIKIRTMKPVHNMEFVSYLLETAGLSSKKGNFTIDGVEVLVEWKGETYQINIKTIREDGIR